jgi:hypothetical protein
MIFKEYGLADIQYAGDKFQFLHAQDIEPTLQDVKALREASDGYSQTRTFRHAGRIPAIEWVKHPEWNHAPELALKWLESDEGKPYRIHSDRIGRSGHIIIK